MCEVERKKKTTLSVTHGHTHTKQKHHSELILGLIQNNMTHTAAYITLIVQRMKGLVKTPIIICKFTIRASEWPFDLSRAANHSLILKFR